MQALFFFFFEYAYNVSPLLKSFLSLLQLLLFLPHSKCTLSEEILQNVSSLGKYQGKKRLGRNLDAQTRRCQHI